MTPDTKRYRIDFTEMAKAHMRWLSARERGIVLDEVERHLTHEPLVETAKKNELRPNALAPWELRVGKLRAFYELSEDEPDVIWVLAVGKKERNRLYIAGEEFQL